MAKTAGDLVEETRRLLVGITREERNSLAASISSTSATSISFNYDLNSLQRGAIIAVDLELMYVWAVDASAKTATVLRGDLGSTAATHANGATVYVNPRFSSYHIFQALNSELDDLSSPLNGLFQMLAVNITYNSAKLGYDLGVSSDQVLDIYEIRYKRPDTTSLWPEIKSFDLSRDLDTTQFASGVALFLHEGAFPGLPMRIRYKAPFTRFAALTDAASAVSGLAEGALDIPPLGAAMRLVSADEIPRNQAQTDTEPRRADEVPAQAIATSIRPLQAIRQARIAAEASRLAKAFPVTRPIP